MEKLNKKEIILYIIIGICTTIINYSTFYLLNNICNINLILSNSISWFITIICAFLGNKYIVFIDNSKYINIQFIKFLIARIITLIFENVILIFGINNLNIKAEYVKIISIIIVVICNYIISKLYIFKKDVKNGTNNINTMSK